MLKSYVRDMTFNSNFFVLKELLLWLLLHWLKL